MDADYTKRRRESEKSRREKRWSMSSMRLEKIVSELMRPISDVRRSFDTDLSALLEEYLTEVGIRALDGEGGGGEGEGEEGEELSASQHGALNFTEAALLLQQSASNYGRKVDYLYQHVINVSDSLNNSTQESPTAAASAEAGAEAAHTPSSRRKRTRSAAEQFALIELEASAGARREAGPARPPPTLPRMYMELEPRVMAAGDAPLLDYALEPIGLLADFQVAWRLQDGLLVDELEGGCGTRTSLRAVPLTELQAAIEAAAPPSPPALTPVPGTPPALTPAPDTQPALEPPAACSTPLPAPTRKERKRRSDVRIEDLSGSVKLLISPELRKKLKEVEEFKLEPAWISRVVTSRKLRILSERKRLREMDLQPPSTDCFDSNNPVLTGGFPGWASAEAEAAAEAAAAAGRAGGGARRSADSDDDGFFEQSSLGDSDDSAHHHTPKDSTGSPDVASSSEYSIAFPHRQTSLAPLADAGSAGSAGSAEGAEWAAWRDGVVARAAAAEARGFTDVRAAARCVLESVRAAPPAPPAPPAPAACDALLAATAREHTDVSRMFLATLFLANAGNVDIIQGPPLTVNTFSVRFVSEDERLYCAAAAETPLAR